MESSSPEEYWRRVVFVPFMDHLNKEFENRFSQFSEKYILGLKLIPSKVASMSADDEATIIHHFEGDLPSPGSLTQEFRRWRTFWNGRTEGIPDTLSKTINSQVYSLQSYPLSFTSWQ